MNAVPNALDQRVDVKVGLTRPRSPRQEVPRLCIVGIATQGSPWLSDVLPDARIRMTKLRSGGTEAVEQLRFSAKNEQGPLPHIASSMPSRIRDAFRLALASGAPEVDLLLVRSEGCMPWDLDRPQISELLGPFLGDMAGALLVYPDAGGPWPNNRAALVPTLQRMVRLRDTVRRFSTRWVDHYQTALMDMVPGTSNENRQILLGIAGNDVALCQWTGAYDDIKRHGWRPGCAAIGGFLAGRGENITQGVVGQNIPLGRGRYVVRSRAASLGGGVPPALDSLIADTCTVLELQSGADRAEIMSTPTFRRPLGEWSISSVRTVKMIHQKLVEAADMFVFRPAREIEATALGASIELVLEPFYNKGIVVGPNGAGAPVVSSGVTRSRTEPGLYVDLTAQVRPWCQQVAVRVMVKTGEQPQLTEQ